DLNDPVAVLLAIANAFEKAGIKTAAYGGLALAAYAEPRETKDADLAVVGVDAKQGKKTLLSIGVEVTPAFDRNVFGGLLITRLTLIGGSSQLNVADLVEPRSKRYAESALLRALDGTLRNNKLRILAPEDFIVFKLLSTIDRDLEDAASV